MSNIEFSISNVQVRRRWRLGFFLVLGLLSVFDGFAAEQRNQGRSSGQSIEKSVASGVAYIKKKQMQNGGWSLLSEGKALGGGASRKHASRYDPGVSALAVYTLLKCECPMEDKSVTSGINYLLNVGILSNTASYVAAELTTYDAAMTSVALSCLIEKACENPGGFPTVIDLDACRRKVIEAVRWLVKAQHRDGSAKSRKGGSGDIIPVEISDGGFDLGAFRGADSGAWSYKLNDSTAPDNSNTQFALLGLRAAQNIVNDKNCTGVEIPRDVWQKALAHLVTSFANSGWSYRLEQQPQMETMTTAGIGGVIICVSSLVDKADTARIMKTREIVQALGFLADAYPKQKANRFLDGYMLFSLERTCMLGSVTAIGTHDWYQDGVTMLLRRQNSDGYICGRGPCSDNGVQTCLGLLFLKKVYVPIR